MTPETERGKMKTVTRKNAEHVGLTSVEIWKVVVRQLSDQIQAQDLVGVSECVHVVTRSSPDHRGLMRKFDQLSYTDCLQAIYVTVRCYRSILLLAKQGQVAGQHSLVNQSDSWMIWPQRQIHDVKQVTNIYFEWACVNVHSLRKGCFRTRAHISDFSRLSYCND